MQFAKELEVVFFFPLHKLIQSTLFLMKYIETLFSPIWMYKVEHQSCGTLGRSLVLFWTGMKVAEYLEVGRSTGFASVLHCVRPNPMLLHESCHMAAVFYTHFCPSVLLGFPWWVILCDRSVGHCSMGNVVPSEENGDSSLYVRLWATAGADWYLTKPEQNAVVQFSKPKCFHLQ